MAVLWAENNAQNSFSIGDSSIRNFASFSCIVVEIIVLDDMIYHSKIPDISLRTRKNNILT